MTFNMLTRGGIRASSVFSNDSVKSPREVKPDRCRVCLKDGDIPLFGRVDISKDVIDFGGIDVAEDDDLPQHICEPCHTLLQAAIIFRKTAQASDNFLTDSYMLDESLVMNNDPEYTQVVEALDGLLETEPYVKKEYIECEGTSNSDSDNGNIFNNDTDTEVSSVKDEIMSQCSEDHSQHIEMQLLKVKDENAEIDPENEMIMIIVSDKNKTKDQLSKPDQKKVDFEECNITLKSSVKKESDAENQKLASHQKECMVCHKVFNKKIYNAHLKEHREKYKKKYNKKYGKVECKFCGKKVSKTYYRFHIKSHGSDAEKAEKVKQCPFCTKYFSKNYLSNHIQRLHPTTEMKQKEDRKNEKFIKCPVCDRKIKESLFKTHVAGHGGSTRRYVCDQCGKVFNNPSPFKVHRLTHGGDFKYQCQFCPYRGVHQALLKIHVRTHTGDYNYKCDHCPARFITKSNLSKHLLRHSRTYKVFCDICKKGFYTKLELDKHNINVHSDKREHMCEICGKGYGHRDTLLSHQLRVHNREKLTHYRGRIPSYLKVDQKNA